MKQAIRVFCGIVAVGAVAFGFLYQTPAIRESRSDNIWLLSLLVAGIAMLIFLWLGRAPLSNKRAVPPEERLRYNVQRVSSVLIVAFLLITLQLLREQVVSAGDLEKPFVGKNAKGEDVTIQDPRLITQKLANQRGRIFDASGKEVAGIAVSKYGLVRRTYDNNSPIKQLLGYFSPLQFGNSGLEDAYDDYLSGKNGANPFAGLQRSLLNEPTVGNDLYLTIDPKLQQTAQDALGQTAGSIVLLDAKSGAVLAMVGYPRFDPATLAFDPTVDDSLWPQQIQDIQARWTALNNDKTNLPLLMRPTGGLYTPGSIFKTITISGMLETGKATPDSTWQDTGSYVVDNHSINDPNRPNKNTTWTSRQGYMFSLNAVFAQMGLQLAGPGLQEYTDKFGFNKTLPFDLPTATSQTHNGNEPTYFNNRVAQAETGFGQGELVMTPLHAALVAAAIGRGDGTLPKPYLVQQIKSRNGAIVRQAEIAPWLQAIRPDTSATVRDIMIASATEGWVGLNGGNLPTTKAVIGGKTGTAELGNGINNAWYIAWASKGDRLFAIAALVDHKAAGEGLRDAMPRANTVLTAALAGVK